MDTKILVKNFFVFFVSLWLILPYSKSGNRNSFGGWIGVRPK
jgi:hypothetical protein